MRKEWMNPDTLEFSSRSDFVLYLKHLKAYETVLDWVAGQRVLEIGCGSGYGSRLLAGRAEQVTTVDLDQDSLSYAQDHNAQPNISYVHADVLQGVPLATDSFDTAIVFQVIEHIEPRRAMAFLTELRRLVKPSGKVIFTTPNKKTRLLPFQKPVNPYHRIEYTARRLIGTLQRAFTTVELLALRASEEIEAIERQRTKQSAFRVFVRNPIRRSVVHIAKIAGLETLERTLKERSVNYKKYQKAETSSEPLSYCTQDFRYTAADLDKAIDFLAICTV